MLKGACDLGHAGVQALSFRPVFPYGHESHGGAYERVLTAGMCVS